MNLAVCTLFEGSYHLGAGALANSLSRAGYRGTLWAGLRGPLPPWAARARAEKPGRHRLAVTPEFDIAFVLLETSSHFAYHKPEFLERTLHDFAPDADGALYFDPDIVVKCPWEVFPRWLSGGLALVEDVNPNLPNRHPQRTGWREALAAAGLDPRRELHRYYNSGFVGVPRALGAFLADWRRTMAVVLEALGGHDHIKFGGPSELFHSTDQDALNMACMLSDAPLAAAGPEAMDFLPGGHLLSHAVGTPKPWEGGFVKRAFQGFPPSAAARNFLTYATEPIPVLPAGRARSLTRALKTAAALSRFYRRV